MKILVTGGSGFIGSNLVDALLKGGHEVTNYDVSVSPYKSGAVQVKDDILDREALLSATKGVDVIYHLAAQANVDFMFKSPVFSVQNNIMGTMNVLDAARANGCKRVIFASTDWVYSGCKDENVDEETKLYPPHAGHIYTSSKIAAEMLMQDCQGLYGVDYTIMRYGIPFGPRGKPTTVTPIFLRKALRGEPLTIKGKGDQFRQFIYIEDLVAGNVLCMHENARNQIINLNGREKVSINMVAECLNEIFENKLSIQHTEARPGDYKGKFVSSEKAKKLLGWEPRHTYKDALRKYAGWFKENEGSP